MRDAPLSHQASLPAPDSAAFADVIVPRRLRRAFTYQIPKELAGQVRIGRQVLIPFGTQILHGLVVGVHARLPRHAPTGALKPIRALADRLADHDLSKDRIELLRWAAEYYAAAWGQCVNLVLPPGASQPPKVRRRYVATEPGRACPPADAGLDESEQRLLERLQRRRNGLSAAALTKGIASDPIKALRHLIELGFVKVSEELVTAASSHSRATGHVSAAPAGLPLQQFSTMTGGPPVASAWPATIRAALGQSPPGQLVLQADRDIRGWCLVEAIKQATEMGRRVLVVTGEVDRAVRLAALLSEAGLPVLLLHGALSVSERATVWQAARTGAGNVLIGTRLAVFAPLPELGLLWVDGEDEETLKEEKAPRYHARDVARFRASHEGAALVWASNHPSLEAWHEIAQAAMIPAIYRDTAGAPVVDVIDVKGFPSGTLLVPALCDGIRGALQQGELAILYLNRKGYASVLHCRDCGTMPQCGACSVALTFHKLSRHLRCHYCGRTKPLPEECPKCRGPHLEPVGSGTERVEETVKRLFPAARVGRMDSEAIRSPAGARAIARLLAAKEIDILIGTEMLFRLPNPPRAAFIGVPDADAGLHVSDFRSAERTYHGLVDAVELARPGGRVMLQTRFVDHHAIAAIVAGDPMLFLTHERLFRELLQYPPFTHLIRLDVSGRVESAVARAAQRWAEFLQTELAGGGTQATRLPGSSETAQAGSPESPGGGDVTILGPSPAPKLLVRGRYCWQILVKSTDLSVGRAAVTRTLDRLEQEQRTGQLRFDVDVDPVAMT